MLMPKERWNKSLYQNSEVHNVWKELGNFARFSEGTCQMKIRVQGLGDEGPANNPLWVGGKGDE